MARVIKAGCQCSKASFDLRPGLFGVALDLVAAALGPKAAAAGDVAEESLGTALERFTGVAELLRDIHVIAFRRIGLRAARRRTAVSG